MRWGREYIKVGERRDNLVQCGCCSASQSVVFSSTGVCFFVCVRACVRGPSVSFVCFFLSGRASVVLRFGQRRGPKRHSHGADLDRNDIVNVLPSWCFFFYLVCTAVGVPWRGCARGRVRVVVPKMRRSNWTADLKKKNPPKPAKKKISKNQNSQSPPSPHHHHQQRNRNGNESVPRRRYNGST